MSHAISPWSQRRREGRSPAVLEAPRRELVRQMGTPPALARGVPIVCWEAPESARFARFEPELQIAQGLAMSRSGLRWYSFLELRRRRKRLLNHPSSRGRRLRAAGRRPRATISRQRSLFGGTFLTSFFGLAKAKRRILTQIRAHR